MSPREMRTRDSADSLLGAEAARWLLRLQESEADTRRRDELFLAWLATSPRHVRLFLETFQTYRLLGAMDPARSLDIQQLLENHHADVIPLHGAPAVHAGSPRSRWLSKSALRFGTAATAVVVVGGLIAWHMMGTSTYVTAIGEQRTCKLDDGSFVYLNTDTRLQVRFSNDERRIRLLQGEALFAVERDSLRPFTVNTGHADVQVIGTQFNVRRRAELTDVTVVEGQVQVTAATTTSSARLGAGEEARITDSGVARVPDPDIGNALAWRERRLVFTDAALTEVAAEFNRYNKTRIRIEGAAARKKQMTGIFDADRPQALILYAMNDETLAVEPDRAGWVIRGR